MIVASDDIINILDNCKSDNPFSNIKIEYTGVNNKNLLKKAKPYKETNNRVTIFPFATDYTHFSIKNTGNIDFLAFLHYNYMGIDKGCIRYGKYERFFNRIFQQTDIS